MGTFKDLLKLPPSGSTRLVTWSGVWQKGTVLAGFLLLAAVLALLAPEDMFLAGIGLGLVILLAVLMMTLMTQRTRLQQAARNLKSELDFHQGLLDALPIPIYYKDSLGFYLGCNRAFAKLLGVKKTALKGMSVHDLVPLGLASFYTQKDRELLRRGGAQEYPSVIYEKSGVQRTVIFHKGTFWGVDGKPGGIVGAVLDITARRAAEDLLQCQAQIIDKVPSAVVATNPDGIITGWNRGAERLYGYTALEAQGRHISFIFPKDLQDAFPTQVIAPLQQKGFQELEMRAVKKSQEECVVVLSFTFLRDRGGEVIGLIGYSLDITNYKHALQALRNSEEQYRRLFNSIDDFIFVHKLPAAGQPGRIVAANDLVCQTFGYRREELFHLPAQKLLAPESYRLVAELTRRIVAEKNVSGELVLTTRDGGRIPVEIHASLIDFQDQPTVLTIARDITERQKAAELKANLEAQLLQAQKMQAIGTLAGGVAHDFNNILMAIIGYTVLARDTLPADSKPALYLQEALRASDRAKNLVEQILTFSRPSATESTPVVMKHLIEEVLSILHSTIPEHIIVHTRLESEATIMADANQIFQVTMNLCTNALHAMQDQGGSLEIFLEEADLDPPALAAHPDLSPGPYLQLTVKDSGGGIDPAVIGRIFEPYFSTKERGKGTGMGLAIVHSIIKEHGGSITVSSPPRQGTTFKILLPRL